MTSDNLSFSVEIDFIPDITEGRNEFKEKMKETAKKLNGTFSLDQKMRPLISGLTKEDVEKTLQELNLIAFGMWPSCILTCTISTAIPIRAVGMSDGWDIYTGKKTFFAFAQFPSDALNIIARACTYYLDHESYQTLDEFIDSTGYETFRDTVLGNTAPDDPTNPENYYGNSWNTPKGPELKEGDFIRPEHNIMQILEVYPDMGPFLMEYGMSCVGCFISYDENLWQAAQSHGMDVFEILGEMNEFIADKYEKPVLTKDTPMEDILTLYPQLLPIFQNHNIAMPQDMTTTIGTLCDNAGVTLSTFIEACDARLRGDDKEF